MAGARDNERNNARLVAGLIAGVLIGIALLVLIDRAIVDALVRYDRTREVDELAHAHSGDA